MGRAFVDEHIIYRYMMMRIDENQLRIRKVIDAGSLVTNPCWIKVQRLAPITDTRFPDINQISLGARNAMVPAEVKFITSKFGYHKPTDPNYQNYLIEKANGLCVIVLKHDHMPSAFSAELLDVWELDHEDFSAFCRTNFHQLLDRQLDIKKGKKHILMAPGPKNFYRKQGMQILPAIESGIWCPQNALTGYQLAENDIVLFIRFKGGSSRTVQPPHRAELARLAQGGRKRNWLNQPPANTTLANWRILDLTVCEVTSRIRSREEYCDIKQIPRNQKLWHNDPLYPSGVREMWPRVFEFKTLNHYQLDVNIKDLYDNKIGHSLTNTLSVFLSQGGKNYFVLERDEYEYLLQRIIELKI